MNAGYILGIIAGSSQAAGYFLYIRQMLEGSSKPNAVSWTLWFFMTPKDCLFNELTFGIVIVSTGDEHLLASEIPQSRKYSSRPGFSLGIAL